MRTKIQKEEDNKGLVRATTRIKYLLAVSLIKLLLVIDDLRFPSMGSIKAVFNK